MIIHILKLSIRYVLLIQRYVKLNPDSFSLQSSRINGSDLPASGGPARRPPAVLRAGMAGGFEVNPQALNPEPVNGYLLGKGLIERILLCQEKYPFVLYKWKGISIQYVTVLGKDEGLFLALP